MASRRLTIVGGSGFVGMHLVAALAHTDWRVRVLTRERKRHQELLVFPHVELVECAVHDGEALAAALDGCDAVINLAGILNEYARPGADFRSVHVELPRKVAEACLGLGIHRLIHMSALNADPEGPSRYLKTKGEGENLVHDSADERLAVTSLQPSVIFGPGDRFFNRFAQLLALTPLVFPLAVPEASFAPVYVGDVVAVILNALDDSATRGRRLQLCGPESFSLRELVEYTGRLSGHPRRVIGLGDGLSRLQARVLEHLPGKPFSYDNYLSLQVPSVCRDNAFAEVGIDPAAIEAVVPGYLGPTQPAGAPGGRLSVRHGGKH